MYNLETFNNMYNLETLNNMYNVLIFMKRLLYTSKLCGTTNPILKLLNYINAIGGGRDAKIRERFKSRNSWSS